MSLRPPSPEWSDSPADEAVEDSVVLDPNCLEVGFIVNGLSNLLMRKASTHGSRPRQFCTDAALLAARGAWGG